MEELEKLAIWMLEHSDKYVRASQREERYAATQARELGITPQEFIRRGIIGPVRTMHEECVFDEREDIVIFAERRSSFGAERIDLDALRRTCRDGYCHRHEFFEMFYVLKGACYNYIDGVEERMPEGSICLYNRQSLHERVIPDDDSIILTLCVRGKAFDTYLLEMLRCLPTLWQFFARSARNAEEPPSRIRISEPPNLTLESLLHHILRAYLLDDESSQTVMKCQFFCLMAELARMKCVVGYRMDLQSEDGERHRIVEDILSTIQTHCDSVTLSNLAASYHFSTGYLSRLIKRYAGKSFQELQSYYWLEKAKALLGCTNLSVDAISELMGSSARSNFERRFRSLAAMSPAQYRQRKARSQAKQEESL